MTLHCANSLVKWSLTSVEVNEEEVDVVGGVRAGVEDNRVFGAGRVKAPPPPGCCPGVAWQRKQVCQQGNYLESFHPHVIAGETVQPVEVEDGKACDACEE